MSTRLTSQIADTAGSWAEAGAAWAALARRGAAVALFQDHGWLAAWWATVAADPALAGRFALYVVILSDAHGPAALAPLVIDRGRWPARLSWMARDVSDYCDLVVAPDAEQAAIWPALCAAMRATGAAFAVLDQLRPDGAAARLFDGRARPGPLRVQSPYLDLAGRSWAEVQQGFSSNLRQELGRKGRRLTKRVPWRFVEYDNDARRRAAVEFVLEHKGRQLAGDAPALAAHEHVFAPFARDVFARDAIGATEVRVAGIEATDGRILAAHLGFADAQRFYYYVPAFDPAFQADSPGQILIGELIRRACEQRIPVFDMLRGDYAYKGRLTDTTVTLRSFMEPLNLVGSAYRLAARTRAGWRGRAAAAPG